MLCDASRHVQSKRSMKNLKFLFILPAGPLERFYQFKTYKRCLREFIFLISLQHWVLCCFIFANLIGFKKYPFLLAFYIIKTNNFSKVYSLSFYFWDCFFIYFIHLLFHCSPFPYQYFRILYINKSFIWHISDKICHMWSLFFNSVYGLLLWYLLYISLNSSVF